MGVGFTLSKGVEISEEVMVYQKRETRLLEKARQKRITEEALVTREPNRKRVYKTLTHHKDAMEAHTGVGDNTEAIAEALLH